jgi:Sulfotransferase family
VSGNGPVFIIGCPRSGTTLLLDLLAGTRAFGYVNALGPELDDRGTVNGRNRVYDIPTVGDVLFRRRRGILRMTSRPAVVGRAARRLLPAPIEPWEFWHRLLPNFRPEFGSDPAVDPSPVGIDARHADDARDRVGALLARQHRDVLLSKYTDFPRVELLRSVFPGARFVHIRRDPHAVANSYAVEIESGRFGTWEYRDWWSAAWPTKAHEHWLSCGATELGFAAHNRNFLVGLVDDAIAATPTGTMTVTYEQLAGDPVGVIESILSFSEVDSRTGLGRLTRSRSIESSNDRWRTRRSAAEAALLDEIFSPTNPWRVP